jgi:5-methylcytosine-specific restriction endonuclease McrA
VSSGCCITGQPTLNFSFPQHLTYDRCRPACAYCREGRRGVGRSSSEALDHVVYLDLLRWNGSPSERFPQHYSVSSGLRRNVRPFRLLRLQYQYRTGEQARAEIYRRQRLPQERYSCLDSGYCGYRHLRFRHLKSDRVCRYGISAQS